MATATKAKTKRSTGDEHIVVGAQINDHSAFLFGVSADIFFTDADIFTQAQLLVTEYYNLDTLSNFWDVYNVEAEAMGQKIVYYPDGLPDIDRTQRLLSEPSDLDRLHPPDPYKSGRMPWIHKINKNFLEATGKLERAYFTAPFSLAANIRGYESLVQDMLLRPAFAHRLFEFLCDEVLVPHIEVMREKADMPNLLMDGRDAWASPPMITLDMMDEYVVKYTERLRDKVGGNLITRGNWGDAKSRDVERFFSQKTRCSPGSLSVLDPDLYEIGPDRVKEYANQHNLFVTAGVDATLLHEGPVEAIVERIKVYIDNLAKDGRCMIHLNQIPGDTPSEHVHAAVAACHAYGRLPVPENLDDVQVEVPKRESFSDFVKEKTSGA
jgi:uroporphyrinogen-III decarboxylase